MAKAIPEGFHSVTPMLTFKDAHKAIEFYKQALGAAERYSVPGPEGKGVMHAELQIGNSILMLGEEHQGQPCKSAESVGCSPVGFYIYVENTDAAFQRALAAGATALMPVQDMFWGDRMGTFQDPFGYSWSLATHIKDVTRQELEEGARNMMAQMAKK